MTTASFQAADAIFVMGAGIMGAGIAQIAAQARHPVNIQAVVTLLDPLDNQYRVERCRVSRELRQRTWLREGGQ